MWNQQQSPAGDTVPAPSSSRSNLLPGRRVFASIVSLIYKATPSDPQQLRSRCEGYNAAWSAKRQEAAAAAHSPNRVKAADELKAHEKPQLYAVDVEQSEDLAHEFAVTWAAFMQVHPTASSWISPALVPCLRWCKTERAACTPCLKNLQSDNSNEAHSVTMFRRVHTHTQTSRDKHTYNLLQLDSEHEEAGVDIEELDQFARAPAMVNIRLPLHGPVGREGVGSRLHARPLDTVARQYSCIRRKADIAVGVRLLLSAVWHWGAVYRRTSHTPLSRCSPFACAVKGPANRHEPVRPSDDSCRHVHSWPKTCVSDEVDSSIHCKTRFIVSCTSDHFCVWQFAM